MADKEFHIKLQLRKDTEANFSAQSPMILPGELCIVTEVPYTAEDGTETTQTRIKINTDDTPQSFNTIEYFDFGDKENSSGGSAEITINGYTGTEFTIGPDNIGALSADGTAVAASKLEYSRTVRTNLASTATASFDGTANITPGVTGTLPLANGGTGGTTASAARINLGATKVILSATQPAASENMAKGDIWLKTL